MGAFFIPLTEVNNNQITINLYYIVSVYRDCESNLTTLETVAGQYHVLETPAQIDKIIAKVKENAMIESIFGV